METDSTVRPVHVGDFAIGDGRPFALIAGPCVIESESHALHMAEAIAIIARRRGIPCVFKASYDKANRSSLSSFRGPGLKEGLRILQTVKARTGLSVLSDVHAVEQVAPAAEVLDILQIPAFLCRQTDLLAAAARSGKPVNVKKGQFLAPWDIGPLVEKLEANGATDILLTERGVTHGYNRLVVDFLALAAMRSFGHPVVFDATHAVQEPGGLRHASGGNREHVPLLARAAVAVGIDALFLEVHDNPDHAKSDGPNMLRLDDLEDLLATLQAIDRVVKKTVS